VKSNTNKLCWTESM